jgi:hypothetical protein
MFPSRVSGHDKFTFLRTHFNYWNMCPSACVFTCELNTTELRHISVMKCAKGYSKIFLDPGFVADMKLSFLACTLTWLESYQFFFCGDIWNPISVPVQSILKLWFLIQQFASETNNTSVILKRLLLPCSCRAEMCVPKRGGHFDHVLKGNKLKISLIVLIFLPMNSTLHVGCI